MSRPREATSVARRMERALDLNLLRAPSRLFWLMWPFRGMAERPRALLSVGTKAQACTYGFIRVAVRL